MSPELGDEIMEWAFLNEKQIYRLTVAAIAEAKKVRPVYMEKKPRKERHAEMLKMLSRPRLELTASDLIRTWLVKGENSMLSDFLDALDIPHEDGITEDMPESVDDDKINAAVDKLLEKYPKEKVIVYLHMFCNTNDTEWENLETMLDKDERLQF